MIGPGDIACAAGTGTETNRGLHQGADHLWMLAHAEIIGRAPDDYFAPTCRRMAEGIRKAAGDALEVGEHPVAPFVPQPAQRGGEIRVVIHATLSHGVCV